MTSSVRARWITDEMSLTPQEEAELAAKLEEREDYRVRAVALAVAASSRFAANQSERVSFASAWETAHRAISNQSGVVHLASMTAPERATMAAALGQITAFFAARLPQPDRDALSDPLSLQQSETNSLLAVAGSQRRQWDLFQAFEAVVSYLLQVEGWHSDADLPSDVLAQRVLAEQMTPRIRELRAKARGMQMSSAARIRAQTSQWQGMLGARGLEAFGRALRGR